MPLPQPKLDDKTFETLVAESMKLIPRQSPEWTDHNRHDPGITLIELFAWLAEMQQYYLNSVGPGSYLKFLKLLGQSPLAATPAGMAINFRLPDPVVDAGADSYPPPLSKILVPEGTKLGNMSLTDDQLIVETSAPLLVLSIKLRKILTSTRRGLKDNTGANGWDGLSYFAFGEEAENESRLYLGFDQAFPAGEQIALGFDLVEDYAVARGRHGAEETLPLCSALITWEYFNAEGEWAPLEIVASIAATVSELENRTTASADCFSSFDVLLAAIEAAPAFKNLSDVARDQIRKTIDSAASLQDVRELLFDPQFLLAAGDRTLMLSRSGRLFFKAPPDMQRYDRHPLNDELLFWLRATVRQSGYELPPMVDSISLNTIDALQRDTVSRAISFSSSGEANQSFQTSGYLEIYALSVLQVRERDGRWQDWEARNDLQSSGPNDRHYVVDKPTAGQLANDIVPGRITITFGDGEHGRIPAAGADQIRYISYLPEFEEERKLGQSNGLPTQSFTLERQDVMAESLMIQIQEPVSISPESTETMAVSCLLSLTRTTVVNEDKSVDVTLVLKSKEDLCGVTIQENLTGGLTFVAAELLAEAIEVPTENQIIIEAGRMPAGSTRNWNYKIKSGDAGGSIAGEIVVTIGANCPTVQAKSPVSLIEIRTSAAEWRWRDWIRVDDFDASRPGDPHFVFEPTSSTLTFGDGICGDIPPAGGDDRNIRIISLQTCVGENGNVARGTIATFAKPFSVTLPKSLFGLQLSQVTAGVKGQGGEELADAQDRARADLRLQYQAVSSADFEFLALNTPGLRVARAKAIPGFSASNKPVQTASVTVVVLPYSLAAKPVPSRNFLRTVCRHLDSHRLITTQIEVVPPNYVQVSVQATVLLRSGFDLEPSRASVIGALQRFLRPIPAAGDTENQGWPFGRTVYKSEIYELIENVPAVDCVEKVVLAANGAGVSRDENGNISITPLSVVYSGDHQVEIVTPQIECGGGR